MDKYVCPCGYVYDPAVGAPHNAVRPRPPWAQVAE
ncbi:MAG: rubredoxin, partial [Dysosmobacter sp.]|nr:rubredoxin [Dysosmobacter sp.]